MKRLFFGYTNEEKASWLIFIVTFIVYAVISMVKSAYAASMASIIGEGIFDKSQAGIVNAGFYLFYGGAQLLGVKIVDKVAPIKFIYITLAGTLISTLGMAFADNFYMMLIFWSFCGLIQFAIWPAVLRIIAEYLLPEHKNKAMTYISFSYCIGMLTNYLVAAIVLNVARWPMLFMVFSVILAICLVLWTLVTKKTKTDVQKIQEINQGWTQAYSEQKTKSTQTPNISLGKILISSGAVFLLIPAFMRSTMDVGLKSWVPTMIIDNYKSVTPSFANMLTTILVFINLAGVFIVNFFYPKRVKNAVWGYALCFLVSLPFTVLLIFTGKVSVAIVVILLTVVTTMMYAGHQLINVIIPSHFVKYNKAGSVASTLNAVASFGTVVANILFGYLAEKYGWNATIVSWILFAGIAFVFAAIASPMWAKFTKRE